ncbi:RNA 2',3'-cyclic phosphodiesterase [Bacteroides sedimenti]|uniref:RNA 2',3'-cyclic phosphodiesterase n=1 Tax=Bacteroides sedimenti TaxID=2136147 RepID=A0ABM8ICG7_9BACE
MRVYIGVDLPEYVKQSLYESQFQLKKLGLKGTWKPSEYFHITLEFLGELTPESIPLLTQVIDTAIAGKRAFRLTIDRFGAFPSFHRPHTLWAGVGGSVLKLNQLQSDLHEELKRNGFELEQSHFKPHISLLSRPREIGSNLKSFLLRRSGKFTVSEVILFESKVVEGKRVYPALYRAQLKR